MLSLCIKPTRGEPLKRLWKGFQCNSRLDLEPWDMPALLLSLKCLIKHSLFGQLQQSVKVTEGWERKHRRRQTPPPDFIIINEAPPRRLRMVLAIYKVFSRRHTLIILAVIFRILNIRLFSWNDCNEMTGEEEQVQTYFLFIPCTLRPSCNLAPWLTTMQLDSVVFVVANIS